MKIFSKVVLLYLAIILLVICLGCRDANKDAEKTNDLFKLLDNDRIGIDFINQLSYDKDFNVYKYRNYYNGGGVALGDINNDDLIDIYFTANLTENKLYLNKGNNQFEDVTSRAGVGGTRSWSTGVTMVDINADGHLDIYVCNSGDIKGGNKANELFINNGDMTFSEKAEEYGLNVEGYSTHASFFDYDKDGDLDVYLLNNSYQAIGSFNLRTNERPNRDDKGGDKLLRNDNGIYNDVSESAGIYGSVIGFGLGITVGDVDNDMWEDIYVSNDFFERDYLYINQKDGTFKEVLSERIGSISGASMGADMADIDNDGFADIFVTEMLPSDPERLKEVTTFEDWNKYQYNVNNGYHHQFTRNTLQYNNGDGTFSELGRYAGVEASDWSWGALFFDMDNDGLKDLFVANGIYQDLTNQDYLQYVANEQVIKSIISDEGVNYKELIDIIPSNPIPNHFYLNQGELSFNRIRHSDIDLPTFSNGAAYGDLDNDGDLDLVINNVNMSPMIYQNLAEQNKSNYITIELKQFDRNVSAIGARIEVTSGDSIRVSYQVQPARGFQSSTDVKSVIGVGQATAIDVKVIWPDLSQSSQVSIPVNQSIVINKEVIDNNKWNNKIVPTDQIFEEVLMVNHVHKENGFNDFNRERMIYHMMSNLTPDISIGDLDMDGKEDLIVTGSKGDRTAIYYSSLGTFKTPSFLVDRPSEQEHTSTLIFDANGDGLNDIYLCSGGVDVSPYSQSLFDELWINKGNKLFEKTKQHLPNSEDNISSSIVVGSDYDADGDIDLFIGERVKIGKYGATCSGYILQNDGQGHFSDVTPEIAPMLKDFGMITSAQFVDLDGDSHEELVITGEFMSTQIFKYTSGKFLKITSQGLESQGWYGAMKIDDINGDDLPDIILGNHGLNSRFEASETAPIKLYFKDFDQNGFPEGIMTKSTEAGDYPYALRHSLIDQLKYLKKRFPDYSSYKSASIQEIFTPEELEGVKVLSADNLKTQILINKGEFNFESIDIPYQAQQTPIYAIATGDFDRDGDTDIIMGGNQYKALPEVGIYDSSLGIFLENIDNESFNYLDPNQSGLKVKGEIRDIEVVDSTVLIGRNDNSLVTLKF